MTGVCRLAVLGSPLRYTLSPTLHRAGLQAIGRPGDSSAIHTPPGELGTRLAALAKEGYRGVNLTHPLKEVALEHLTRNSDVARLSRSVNTVTFEDGNVLGETTDGAGFLDFLAGLGREVRTERVVLLGAGGAARSLALALAAAGAQVTASARRPDETRPAWRDVPHAGLTAWRSEEERAALARATLVVNATPLSGPEGPLAPGLIPRGACVVDLVYGPEITPWIAAARAAGHTAYDGLGLLVHQAARSLAIWTGCRVPIEPLERAVGWPR